MAKESQSERATQKTKPKQGKPVEIPVPKHGTFDKLVKRATKGAKTPPQDH